MRAAPVVLVSMLAHAPVVALVAMWTTPAKRARQVQVDVDVDVPPPARAPEPTNETSEPIEVAFLVEEPAHVAVEPAPRVAMVAPQATAAPTSTGTTSTPAITTGTSGTSTQAITTSTSGASTEAHPGTEPTGPTGLMKMRGPDLGLDQGTAERIAAGGGAAPRDEVHKSGKLESRPGGGAAIYDRVTTVTVDRDGTAHFADKKDIDLHFKLPIPKFWEVDEMRKDLGHTLTEWYKDPEAGKRYGRTQDLPRHLQASEGACDSWGNTMCDDPLAPEIEQRVRERTRSIGGSSGIFGTLLGGPADITAYLHRKFVGDPYASRKLKLLDDTRDERVAMGVAFRAEQAARSAEIMRGNLERLWKRESRAIARRAALFELWDECAEDEAGLRARLVVIGWIRSHLPAGSADAYSTDELAALQARRTSTASFAPYAE